MGETVKHINLGILAHVDAGKTTLTEALLYKAGVLRKAGRVDTRDSFLDTDVQERERGITIYSKQAELSYGDTGITLLDTPGHVDFSAEAESVLQVLDLCILLVSAADGVKGHTLTLWSLLRQYGIPVMIFVNKMDQPGADGEKVLAELQKRLHANCLDLSRAFSGLSEEDEEAVALCDESLMEAYLGGEACIDSACIAGLVERRRLFPVFFGSALKMEGIELLLRALTEFSTEPQYGAEFAARVFKISRDAAGNRLTHLKIMGGVLHGRDVIGEEKVNQIRIYSGEKYETVTELKAGRICAVTGLNLSSAGMGLGALEGSNPVLLEPVLSYRVYAEDGTDDTVLLAKLRVLEEEDPQLRVFSEDEDPGAARSGRGRAGIRLRVMGEVQLEVLKRTLKDRFAIEVRFGEGTVVYKETIAAPVEGVGHFEPLRHYAEVHLLLEPDENGSGLSFDSLCSEDILERNWQRLILTHLREKTHRGVLTGSPLTDMKIRILTGRAHPKHTEGGDFRQATYRAVRQGLMQAESILLEPYYFFRIELPVENVGRAMTDVENMHGKVEAPEILAERAMLTGTAPVSCIQNYAKDLAAYTGGMGQISLELSSYGPCHNAEEVIEKTAYLPEADLRNTPDSVFCAHGAGFVVPWNEVWDYMHLESAYHAFSVKNERKESDAQVFRARQQQAGGGEMKAIGTDEVDAILNRTFYSNSDSNVQAEHEKRKGLGVWKNGRGVPKEYDFDEAYADYRFSPQERKKQYLVVDGYNMVFAWKELKELAAENMDSARDKLIDILSDFQGTQDFEVLLVFDAYRIKGRSSSKQSLPNLQLVYTGEGQTADQYIERFAAENGKKYDITVATSDRLEQTVAWGNCCRRMSARELEQRVSEEREKLLSAYGRGAKRI
ncbi:MAG: NYN domain-containing protein [Lachnospiraceae bacterium]|nr:NYN domain-containing protein [Lachnospiraceae bacterium]